tara:strand:+ start:142 stop:294 length:153 start_codon:yes stop_codon:yes gene_type:complete
METVTACTKCNSEHIEHDIMVLAMGQEGKAPKEIMVVTCNDCGETHHIPS